MKDSLILPPRTYRIHDYTESARLPEIGPGGVLCIENHSDRPVTLMVSRGVSPLRDVIPRYAALRSALTTLARLVDAGDKGGRGTRRGRRRGSG